ncbi:MAG: AAA family ATPase [Desulfuromonadaceae bacterium]|nr:AAA family ATPase [Desulfuromonadaceae bacterium]
MKQYRLSPEELTWRCDPAQFEFKTTEKLCCLEETIGQDRALAAIEFGLSIEADGFNVFILGEAGTGRSSTIRKLLEKRSLKEPVPDDWCYVHNFGDGSRPTHVRLPAGKGKDFRRDVDALVVQLAAAIPKLFESKEYEQTKNQIANESQEQNKKFVQELEEQVNKEGFLLQRTVGGLVLVPTKDKEPISQKDFAELEDDERQTIEKTGVILQDQLNQVLRKVVELEKEMRAATLKMEKDLLSRTLCHLYEDLAEKYQKYPKILAHFENCIKNIIDRVDEFRPAQGAQMLPGGKMAHQEPSFDRYRINLFVDNSDATGAPVVYEANPTYFNLFGRIEHIITSGTATTNFTMVKSGALHRANGGYLILDCREMLMNLFSYEALKRSLRNGEVKIEDMAEQYRLIATVSLKPEAVPLRCKVILIGVPWLYYLLYQLDPDFRKYFKVKADFDRMMDNTWENVQQYALFVATKCKEENLLPFASSGVARVIEHAARLIDDKNRLSSRFIDVADLIREAAFFAKRHDVATVEREHVELAIESKIYRSNRVEERVQEMIDDGTLLIDTEGEVVGQLNGLSVYMLGDYSFGRPTRITVRTFMGKGGVINIEREAKLSGPIYDKGLLILGGFIGDRFAQDKPLALAASICFEQSYGGVEGDSASSAEIYGLLSALSGLPLSQAIAVTGSVNQRGQVQAIGGVNEKIEGFYVVCKTKGLNGKQGVIIPASNAKNLMLKQEVVDAVASEKFHVWAVSDIDQGIELLTGVPAGEPLEDGTWPEGTVNYLVNKRLLEMAEGIFKFGREEGKEPNG